MGPHKRPRGSDHKRLHFGLDAATGAGAGASAGGLLLLLLLQLCAVGGVQLVAPRQERCVIVQREGICAPPPTVETVSSTADTASFDIDFLFRASAGLVKIKEDNTEMICAD